MSQSLSRVIIHMIFSTKNRVRALAYPELRADLDAFAGGILRHLKCPAIIVGSVIDHMHILYIQSRTVPTATVAETVKRETSKWIKQQKAEVKDPYIVKFAWQSGYAAFSVSESNVEAVRTYIAGQEEHHKRVTFQDEYRLFLKRHAVAYDEKYVWD